jgi:hypothetical protein
MMLFIAIETWKRDWNNAGARVHVARNMVTNIFGSTLDAIEPYKSLCVLPDGDATSE